MSETLRDLVVSLSLNSDNFTRNTKSIRKQIQEAEPAFKLASAGVGNFESIASVSHQAVWSADWGTLLWCASWRRIGPGSRACGPALSVHSRGSPNTVSPSFCRRNMFPALIKGSCWAAETSDGCYKAVVGEGENVALSYSM